MQWEKQAADKLEELVQVVREPFRGVIRSAAQAHAEKYATTRKNPHVTVKEAVLGFLRARSHKLTTEGSLLLKEFGMEENEFTNYHPELK
ncbi:MAG: hypothetical protein KGJ59_09930 [Bacteroidota bacterium]|nr:hypothetical protein [Bacteroidota bacterium]